MLHRRAADAEAVGVVLAALGGSVDDQVHGAGGDHIQNVGVGLRDAVDPLALDARLLEHVAGAGGGKEAYGCFLAGAYDTYI